MRGLGVPPLEGPAASSASPPPVPSHSPTEPLGYAPRYAGWPVIHQSDIQLFLRCRRRWYWESRLHAFLEPIDEGRSALWFGTGWHFALEDYHGYRRFPTPAAAFAAYVEAWPRSELPPDYEALTALAEGMLDYYANVWLPRRPDRYETLWRDGVPQVEVPFVVPIPGLRALYGGTFDRIVTDADGRLYVLDYKTAARFELEKLAHDAQVSLYYWAARQLYGEAVEGCIWQYHRKAVPQPPMVLRDGSLSRDRRQPTTYALYHAALLERYGEVPAAYVPYLNELAAQETAEGDAFIRRDVLRRNAAELEGTERRLYWVARDMLTRGLPLYPNYTRDCAWDCPFRTPCLALDAGHDWEDLIAAMYRRREELHAWRARVRWPDHAADLVS
jgi:hypothetical protein